MQPINMSESTEAQDRQFLIEKFTVSSIDGEGDSFGVKPEVKYLGKISFGPITDIKAFYVRRYHHWISTNGGMGPTEFVFKHKGIFSPAKVDPQIALQLLFSGNNILQPIIQQFIMTGDFDKYKCENDPESIFNNFNEKIANFSKSKFGQDYKYEKLLTAQDLQEQKKMEYKEKYPLAYEVKYVLNVEGSGTQEFEGLLEAIDTGSPALHQLGLGNIDGEQGYIFLVDNSYKEQKCYANKHYIIGETYFWTECLHRGRGNFSRHGKIPGVLELFMTRGSR
jgi:hypothetical protein